MNIRRAVLSAVSALALAACTTNSMVDTGETASRPSPEQISEFHVSPPISVNPYIKERRAPKMDKRGCSMSMRKEERGLVIPGIHPDEVYCVRIAALHSTRVDLPPGSRLLSTISPMSRFVGIESANTVEHDVMMLTSKCVPPRKDEAGILQPLEIHQFVDRNALPFCPPGRNAELTVFLSDAIIQFKLALNENTHDARVIVEAETSAPRPIGIPVRPKHAEDLYATAIGDEPIPWTPDDAWSDAVRTVVVWYRPMPALPALMMGPNGEQRASPSVIVNQGAVAMVLNERVTRFQLRLDDRTLAISEVPPQPPQS